MLKKISVNLLMPVLVLFLITGIIGCTGNQGIENQTESTNSNEEISGLITISGAWALYPMTVKWADEFMKIYPEIQIDISAGGAGKGMADALAETVDLGMVSREIYQEEINQGAWYLSVTKDAVVPMFNKSNPFSDDILSQGIKKETLVDMWITGKAEDWKVIISASSETAGSEADNETKINVYTRSDSCGAAQVWAEYLGGNQEDLLGVGIYGDPGLLEAVKKDNLGVGYNNINYAYDANTKLPVEGTMVLPIDLNNNNQIDEDEDFYTSLDKIIEAIASDKYPSPPARDLYFVSKGVSDRQVVVEFLKWILTDGQKYVHDSGYINLTDKKLEEELKKITG